MNRRNIHLAMVALGLLASAQARALVVTAHPVLVAQTIVVARPGVVAKPAPIAVKPGPAPVVDAPAVKAVGPAPKNEVHTSVLPVVVPHPNTSSTCDDSQKKSKNNSCTR